LVSHFNLERKIEKTISSLLFIKQKLIEFRNKKRMNSWDIDKTPYENRSVCVNEDDPIICEELKDIEDPYFYALREGKYYYGFDIRTIFSIILLGRKNQNPLTRKNFSKNVYHDCLVLFKKIKGANKSVFFEEENENIEGSGNTQNDNRQQNNILANGISHILHEFGYYITDADLLSLSRRGLDRAQAAIYNIWFYNMSEQTRGRFDRNNEIQIHHPNAFYQYEHVDATNVLLKLYEQMITLPECINDKKMGALYVVISLTYGSNQIASRFPYLQGIFEN
jgi:hypothetical protein